MKLHRFAQVLAGLSLGSLGASAWMIAALSTTLQGGGYFLWSPQVLLGRLIEVLYAGSSSLALAGAVLLLTLFWQCHQRGWFITLLVATLVLVFTQDSGLSTLFGESLPIPILLGLFYNTPDVLAGQPAPMVSALYQAVFGAPSVLLALVVLGCGLLGSGAARRHPSITADEPSADESSLEIYVESLRAPTAD